MTLDAFNATGPTLITAHGVSTTLLWILMATVAALLSTLDIAVSCL